MEQRRKVHVSPGYRKCWPEKTWLPGGFLGSYGNQAGRKTSLCIIKQAFIKYSIEGRDFHALFYLILKIALWGKYEIQVGTKFVKGCTVLRQKWDS